MPLPQAFAWLPEEICFSLTEIEIVLAAVDIAVSSASRGTHGEPTAHPAIRAKQLITRKLWEELADILEMNGDQHG